jgi:hypothetical protein
LWLVHHSQVYTRATAASVAESENASILRNLAKTLGKRGHSFLGLWPRGTSVRGLDRAVPRRVDPDAAVAKPYKPYDLFRRFACNNLSPNNLSSNKMGSAMDEVGDCSNARNLKAFKMSSEV